MTEQPSGASQEISVGEPQSLEFQLIADDDRAAVYEALLVDCKSPGSPVLALTVTVASSVRRGAGKELDKLLGGIKAAFLLLSKPPPDDGGPDVEDPFDIDTQVQFEFRLASFDGPKPAGLALTVETTTVILPVSNSDSEAFAPVPNSGGGAILEPLVHHVPAGLSDHWHANNNISFTANVTSSIGDGTLSSRGKPSIALHPHQTRSTSGKVVNVTASPKTAMTYTLTGSGHL
jgi:hypothetical protein